jgi:hypothetical protein
VVHSHPTCAYCDAELAEARAEIADVHKLLDCRGVPPQPGEVIARVRTMEESLRAEVERLRKIEEARRAYRQLFDEQKTTGPATLDRALLLFVLDAIGRGEGPIK